MRGPWWLPVTTAILIVVIGVTAHVQWRWIAALTRGEEEHERRVLDLIARSFTSEIERQVNEVIALAQRGPEPGRGFDAIRDGARDPRLIAGIYIEHNGLLDDVYHGPPRPVDWPPSLAALRTQTADLRRRGPIEPTAPAIVVPTQPMRPAPPPPRDDDRSPFGGFLGGPPPEEPRATEEPRNRDSGPPPRRHGRGPLLIVPLDRDYLTGTLFPELAHRFGDGFDIAVSDGTRTVYRSGAWGGERADATAPLLHESGWRVFVRNHDGSIADLAERTRRHNLYLASHVLLLLAVSFGFVVWMAGRAERLRTRQLQFVAGITHELNTPLAALRSAGQNLADGVVADPPQVARYGAMIARESSRLGDLVAQVLAYSRLQTRPRPNRAPANVAAIIDAAIDETRWLAEQKKADVRREVDELPTIDVDADAITRAVQNLIANAIRHGGDAPSVTVCARRDGNAVAITVEDDGPGIAAADAAHLFEPFYRGRDAAARGTGLGLTIVSQIAKMHGGSVTFDTRRARGAAFTLRVPATTHA